MKAAARAEVIALGVEGVDADRQAALEQGDARALDAVLRELLPFVRGLIFRVLGPGPGLDDATQDALIELSKALLRWQGRSSLRTYAGRIAVRVAYRHLRRRVRDREREQVHHDEALSAASPSAGDPEASCIGRERLARLYHHLDQLPPKHRLAFVMCDVEGMTPTEAAALVRSHPVTMRSHLARARRRLRALLREDGSLGEMLRGGQR